VADGMTVAIMGSASAVRSWVSARPR